MMEEARVCLRRKTAGAVLTTRMLFLVVERVSDAA